MSEFKEGDRVVLRNSNYTFIGTVRKNTTVNVVWDGQESYGSVGYSPSQLKLHEVEVGDKVTLPRSARSRLEWLVVHKMGEYFVILNEGTHETAVVLKTTVKEVSHG